MFKSYYIKTLTTFLVVSCFVLNQTIYAQNNKVSIETNEKLLHQSNFQPLYNFSSSKLQNELKNELYKNATWKQLIESRKMCIGIVDLKDPNNIQFASLNGDVMLYAASLPKLVILLAVEDALENGEVEETKAVHEDMRLMISQSNNQAATRLMDLVGPEKLESVVRDPKYGFYDEEQHGGLWVGKRYASGGTIYREPLKNLSHAATVNQVCRFYYMLIHGKLVSEERSKHMLSMLVAPELFHKFVNSLVQIHPNAKLYRKSGTWKYWHADSVIVMASNANYILVGLIEDARGEQIMRSIVKPLDNILKEK